MQSAHDLLYPSLSAPLRLNRLVAEALDEGLRVLLAHYCGQKCLLARTLALVCLIDDQACDD